MWLDEDHQGPVRLTLTAAEAAALRSFLDEHAEDLGANAEALLEQMKQAGVEPQPRPARFRYEFVPPRDLAD